MIEDGSESYCQSLRGAIGYGGASKSPDEFIADKENIKQKENRLEFTKNQNGFRLVVVGPVAIFAVVVSIVVLLTQASLPWGELFAILAK